MFEVSYTTVALKRRKRLPRNIRELLTQKIEAVAVDPHGQHNNAKKLQAVSGYRLTVGDWRILYELDTAAKVLLVLEIRHRNEGY